MTPRRSEGRDFADYGVIVSNRTPYPDSAGQRPAEMLDPDAAFKSNIPIRIRPRHRNYPRHRTTRYCCASQTDPGAAAAELAARIASTCLSCTQILTIATEKQVPVLASLLLARPGTPGAEVADAARGVLEAIPGLRCGSGPARCCRKASAGSEAGIVIPWGFVAAYVVWRGEFFVGKPALAGAATGTAPGNICGAYAESKLGEVSTAQGNLRIRPDAYLKCGDSRREPANSFPQQRCTLACTSPRKRCRFAKQLCEDCVTPRRGFRWPLRRWEAVNPGCGVQPAAYTGIARQCRYNGNH